MMSTISRNKIDTIKHDARHGLLDVEQSFLFESSQTIQANVNGCGAANAKFDFVPDSILGLDISDCCVIHDYDYFNGSRIEDKKRGDRRFRNNMLRKLNNVKGWQRILKWSRRVRIQLYFEMVDRFGGPAFWDGKSNGS